ncbi:hypothetical protein VOA_001470 [Vibrio sp. RC586]|nr:hypothetical protein VOA_001470 [Vibrio sp. RC586]
MRCQPLRRALYLSEHSELINMGRAKEFMLEQEERGFYSVGDKFLCSRCIGEEDLGRYVRAQGDIGECTYCGNKRLRIIHFDELMEFLVGCIKQEYGDPNNVGVAWDKGWCGYVMDSYDLLAKLSIPIENMELQNDIISSLDVQQWCKRDFYNLSPSEAYLHGWKSFVHVVKHKSRYSFYRAEEDREFSSFDEIPPKFFMDSLSNVVDSLNLYRNILVGERLLRVRVHDKKVRLNSAHEIGSPPVEFAVYPNRMSPSGISMFYGAFDRRTAIAETFDGPNQTKVASVGTFEVNRELVVIDFSKLPPYEGLLSGCERDYRHQLSFVYDFLSDFTAPVRKDGLEHIDYVPTQVVSEHFRFIHKTKEGKKVDGIIYPSSKLNKRNAIVLFCDDKDCVERDAKDGLLRLISLKRINPNKYI